jgi:endo-1,4-beta-xylanase
MLPVMASVALAQTATAPAPSPTPSPAPAPQLIQLLPPVPTKVIARGNTAAGGPAIPDAFPTEAPHPPSVILWPYGAPGSEAHKNEAEIVGWRQEADIVFPILYNIHNPSITPFLPTKDTATGCAVIIAPGGGHMFQTIDREGYDLGKWLADHGVAAFVLKYRLARDTVNIISGAPQPYTVARDAKADALRAVRVIRSRAAEWGVDPSHVGIIGFSAGGEVALDAGLDDGAGDPNATDPVDRLDGHPSFLGIIYPGQPPETRAADWAPPPNFPPTFFLCASNDPSATVSGAPGLPKLYVALHTAKIPVELHIFEEGGHGFGVRQWDYSVSTWPNLFRGWLNDRGYLKK